MRRLHRLAVSPARRRWRRRGVLRIDLRAQGCRIRLRQQAIERHLHEIGIAQIAVPVDECAPHRLGDDVHVSRCAERRERVVTLEDVQDFAHRDAARRGRRHRIDRVTAVGDLDGLAPFGLVARQIFLGYEPSAAFHLSHDQVGDLAAIEHAGAGVADELQRAREVVLLPQRPRCGRAVIDEELRPARREARQHLPLVVDVAAAGGVDDVAPPCQADRRRDQRGPWQAAVALPRFVQARDASRHARREMSHHAFLGDVAGRIEIHVA